MQHWQQRKNEMWANNSHFVEALIPKGDWGPKIKWLPKYGKIGAYFRKMHNQIYTTRLLVLYNHHNILYNFWYIFVPFRNFLYYKCTTNKPLLYNFFQKYTTKIYNFCTTFSENVQPQFSFYTNRNLNAKCLLYFQLCSNLKFDLSG